MTPAPITPAASSSAAPSNPKIENIPGHADLLKRQEELERKEAELERRERQMIVSEYIFLNSTRNTFFSFCLCVRKSFKINLTSLQNLNLRLRKHFN